TRRAIAARSSSSAVSPRRIVQSTTIASPFTACGTPIAAASTTAGWAVAAATDVPVAVVVDDRPVAVDPGAGEAGPVRLDVALRGVPEAAGHARLRRSDHQLAHLAAKWPALGIRDIRGRPRARAVEGGRPDRR